MKLKVRKKIPLDLTEWNLPALDGLMNDIRRDVEAAIVSKIGKRQDNFKSAVMRSLEDVFNELLKDNTEVYFRPSKTGTVLVDIDVFNDDCGIWRCTLHPSKFMCEGWSYRGDTHQSVVDWLNKNAELLTAVIIYRVVELSLRPNKIATPTKTRDPLFGNLGARFDLPDRPRMKQLTLNELTELRDDEWLGRASGLQFGGTTFGQRSLDRLRTLPPFTRAAGTQPERSA